MKTRKLNDVRPARRIHLKFAHPTAATIFVAGTFNDWRPTDTPLAAVGNGVWARDLALPPGSYEYRLIADGQWMADPAAPRSVPNPFGGVNSILEVPNGSNDRKEVGGG